MSADKEFDRKAKIVAEAWAAAMESPDEWILFTRQNELGLPFAFLHHTKRGTLNKDGKSWVEQTYERILIGLGIEESDYQSFDEMQQAWMKKDN